MSRLRRVVAVLASVALSMSCGGPLEPEMESDAVSTRQDPLVQTCASTTSSFVTRSDPSLLRTAAHLVVAGESNSSSWGFGESVLTVPAGTRRTTVSTSLRIDEGGVTTMVASPLPTSYSGANLRAAITVLAADGTVMCEQETMLTSSWVVAFSDRRVIPPGTIVPLSCTFDHDARGLSLRARLELRNWAIVFGGEAHAEARGSYPAFTQRHCGLEVGWCTHAGSRLVNLDANGDGRTDQLCHTPSTSHIQMNLTPSSGVPDELVDFDIVGFCGGTDTLVTGDVTGDGFDDLVCVTPFNRRVRVKRSLGGTFETGFVESSPTVPAGCERPIVADFNGDGRDDLLCQFASGATPSVERSDGTAIFNGADYTVPTCISPLTLRGEYLAGDVNGDGRVDLVCHEGGATPRKIVRVASSTGTMSNTVSAVPAYCSHTGARLVLADANGDGRDDQICLTDGTGFVHGDFAAANGSFDGATELSGAASFCVGGGRVLPVDFDGDRADGLVCQQTSPVARNLYLPRF